MAASMQAVRVVEVGKPLECHEMAVPEPGPGQIRVKVRAAGICHSDAHYRDGTAGVAFVPITPGHEVAGVVDKL
ncbi:MAG: alcohol dehydrogenase catalytic domain-containing protein, partial [Rhodanobacter sp.]